MRDINVKIADRDFRLTVASENAEGLIRFAAERVSKMMDRYNQKYPDRPFEDKLLFVTLTQAMKYLEAEGRIKELTEEHDKLAGELSSYLQKVENINR